MWTDITKTRGQVLMQSNPDPGGINNSTNS